MKSIAASILLLASVASAQLVRGGTVQTSRVEPVLGAAAARAAAAAPAAVRGTARAVSAGGAAAGAAGPPAQTFGPAFFGPGINNPIALAPHPLLVQRAQEVVASNPNVRVLIDIDGTAEFTDQFGREVEVLDSFGRDALEVPGLEVQLELQKQQQQIQQRRALLMQQLAALNTLGGAGGIGGLGGHAAGAGGAAAANRFIIRQ